jgi:hypothetical protein
VIVNGFDQLLTGQRDNIQGNKFENETDKTKGESGRIVRFAVEEISLPR